MLRNLKLTKRADSLLVWVERMGFLLAFVALQTQNVFRPDFFVVILFGIAVTASFGKKQTYNSALGKINFGLISLSQYFADAPARYLVCELLPEAGRNERIIPCILIYICFTFVVYYFGQFLDRLFARLSLYAKRELLETHK